MKRWKVPAITVAPPVLLIAPLVLLSPYRLGVLALVGAYGIAALAQNLLAGYAGVPSLGNVAFFGTSAYVTASLASQTKVPWEVAVVMGIGASGCLGLLVGLPALRISGMHLAIVTVALVFVSQELMVQRNQIEGQSGVTVNGPQWLLGERGLYIATIVVVVLTLFVLRNMLNARSGRAVVAVAESPYAALSSGIDSVRYRLMAFIVSGILTGLAGEVYLYYAHTVTPGSFPLDLSLAFLTMMIVGGTRSLGGSLLGAALLGLLPQFLRLFPAEVAHLDLQASVSGIYALCLLAAIRFFPDGVWGLILRR